MNQPVSKAPTNGSTPRVRYCDRCARRATALHLDDLSLQELCDDCVKLLSYRRGALAARSRQMPA